MVIAECSDCIVLSVQGVGGERRAKEREESAGKIGCEWCGVRGRARVPRVRVYPTGKREEVRAQGGVMN